jgi:beta-galactosidase
MSKLSRRDFLKSGIAASGAPSLLPAAGGLFGAMPAGLQGASEDESAASSTAPRQRLLLDFGWRFHLGHADDPQKDFGYGRGDAYQKTGDFFLPSRPNFDDSGWRAIDLPHDWAVELPFQDDHDLIGHGAKPLGRDHPATSIGWYRRVFEIPAEDAGKRLSLEFDGVFRDSMAALNGNFLGRNMSGYAPFRYDITDHANYGGKNILVVRVDATEFEGWFYEGAGIYRHVWLVKTNPVHVPQWGVFVRCQVDGDKAGIGISTEIVNEADEDATCTVLSIIEDDSGDKVATARSRPAEIEGSKRSSIWQEVTVHDPKIWSIEKPQLYRLLTTIEVNGKAVDRCETTFGIRTIRFDAEKGFFLNGKPVKLQGTCNHQDHAGVGSALPDGIQYYRIARLKAMGSNALRTSHNPPTPELLDACDRLGMVVMDETRMFSSDREGLSQLSRLVRRDRNHPSVILWSTGNEEPEQSRERGARICATMKRLVRRLDPTRPITQAMNGGWGKGISAVLDVQGFNYNLPYMDDFHQKFPHQPCVGTEVASTVSTRGIYANDPEKGYVSSYDVNHPSWASTAEEWWKMYDARAWLAGGFVWTGFDYRGEPTPYGWPCISSHFGILDTCGFPKDLFFYYRAWWTTEPVLHVFPHWNWAGKEGKEIDVWCFSNLDKIELFLNGESLGAKTIRRDSHVAWKVKYAPGVLEAKGYRGGELVLVVKRETAGPPATFLLRLDRNRIAANGEDVSVVQVQVVDSKGRLVPVADNMVSFQISGPGKVIGVGNGDPSCHEPDKASQRSAFNGLCCAIVQSQKQVGEIRLQAASPGLESATAVIHARQAAPRPAVA